MTNELIELLNSKKIYSRFSHEPVIFVDAIDLSTLDKTKVYSDGLSLYDCPKNRRGLLTDTYYFDNDGKRYNWSWDPEEDGFEQEIKKNITDKVLGHAMELYNEHKKGVIEATKKLANYYLERHDYVHAEEFVKALAKMDIPEYKFQLAMMHKKGKGIFRSPVTSFSLLEELEGSPNNGDTLYELGECYRIGSGTKKNYDKAIEYYKKTIEYWKSEGEYHENAFIHLIDIYLDGEKGYWNPVEAKSLIDEAFRLCHGWYKRKRITYRRNKLGELIKLP